MNITIHFIRNIQGQILCNNEKYSEDKSTSSISCPTITKRSITEKSSEKNRRLSKSLDAHSVRTKKVQISSDFAPKSVRSVTIRWTDQSIGSFQTAQSTIGLDQVLNWFTHSWSESEQNDFLRRLIVKFDERQQYFTSCVITQRLYRDFICLLPRKLAYQILDHLTPQDLARARRVCKNWKSIIDQEPDLWRPKSRSNQLDENSNNQIDWETFQKQSVLIRRNWAKGTARLIKCSGHKQRVLSICGNETHLATGSLDRTIKIWILKDGQLYQTLHGHNKGVWTLKFISAVLLISGGYDATIKLWNINTTNCLRTLLAHNGPVWSLACSNIYCVSGSQDRTARLWRLPRCELYATLTGHTCSIFGVDLNQEQNLCATASADRTVRLWSLTTRQCLKILYGTTDDHIMAVSLQQGYVAYSFGFRITVYRITVNESEKCIIKKVLETQEHHGRIESLQLILLNKDDKQPSLVSAGQDGLVKFWDLNHIVSQHTFNARSSELVKINCIYVDRTHIVTVGDDCLVKILDFASRIN